LFCFAWDRPHLVMPDFEAALLDPVGVSTAQEIGGAAPE